MTQHDPAIYLLQMHDYAREALQLPEGRSRGDLDDCLMLKRAIERVVSLIGEAATKVPSAIRERYPRIPWHEIVGMRNWPIHGYEVVDSGIVWQTLTESRPELLSVLEDTLSDLGVDHNTTGDPCTS